MQRLFVISDKDQRTELEMHSIYAINEHFFEIYLMASYINLTVLTRPTIWCALNFVEKYLEGDDDSFSSTLAARFT